MLDLLLDLNNKPYTIRPYVYCVVSPISRGILQLIIVLLTGFVLYIVLLGSSSLDILGKNNLIQN